MTHHSFKGLGVALVTPFSSDFSIDYESLEKIINHVIKGGCDYIVALGTTAETPTLTKQEKYRLGEFIAEITNKRVPIMVGIGGNNTLGVIDDILNWDLKRFDAILSVCPYYNKPSQEGLFQHYKNIADVSPLPIMLYNVPGRTGVNLSAATILRLSENCDKIIGVKEASGNHAQWEEILKHKKEEFQLISGNDSDTYTMIGMGAEGVISVLANALPKEIKNLVTLCQTKKDDEALQLQTSLNSIIGYLFEDGNPGGVKDVMSQMGLLQNILRLPLVPVNKNLSQKLNKEIADFLLEK